MISLIAALTTNHVIGRNNTIPWFLPIDLDWFKKNTLHKPIVMGRCTWETLPLPLSGRMNIILSRVPNKSTKMVKWVTTIEDVFRVSGTAPEIMVIGGGDVYQQFISSAKRLYLTHIKTVIAGDTYFPYYDRTHWQEVFSACYCRNTYHKYNLLFEILERYNECDVVFSKKCIAGHY
ncbi:Dihydrofolate reductase [Candidatus Erwinia haradaeae]|uniref:Dihydrofolate reductase n=1 Tax=Candidatus Erwinia haradaeae TaxID=1922217 RepID=A0A451DAP0_9GAMM|nr:Dihydrofolate reductase [Candidatus Erwinia haradaeae]